MVTFIFKSSEGKKETFKLPSAQGLFHIWYQNVPSSFLSRSFRVFDLVLQIFSTLPVSFLLVTVYWNTYWELYPYEIKVKIQDSNIENAAIYHLCSVMLFYCLHYKVPHIQDSTRNKVTSLWEHTIDEKLGQTPCICIGSKDHPWIEDLTA